MSTSTGITAYTSAVREWLETYTQCESWQWMGDTLWVESRYAGDIIREEKGFSL